MKKVIAFIGSPRENGNTAFLVEELVKGAKECSAQVKVYRASTMNIKPCQGCFQCRQAETCATEDDMQEVYKDLKDAQVLVIGSPVYMGQVTAQTKMFLDRLFPIIDPDFKPRYGVKKVALVFSQGNPQVEAFKEYFDYLAGSLKILGLEVVSTIVCAGAIDPQKAAGDSQLRARAFELGKTLISG